MRIPRSFKSGLSAQAGFTLIELMVVIAIIALLTGIILTNLTGSKAKSRDAKRASDLAQIQLAIEEYFDRCDQYPTSPLSLSSNGSGACPSGITLGSFISQIPTDPTNSGKYVYYYVVNSASQPTDYIMHATFETVNSASPQSATSSPTWFSTMYPTPPWSGGAPCDNNYSYCVRPD